MGCQPEGNWWVPSLCTPSALRKPSFFSGASPCSDLQKLAGTIVFFLSFYFFFWWVTFFARPPSTALQSPSASQRGAPRRGQCPGVCICGPDFVVAAQGTPLDPWLWRPEGLVFLCPMVLYHQRVLGRPASPPPPTDSSDSPNPPPPSFYERG